MVDAIKLLKFKVVETNLTVFTLKKTCQATKVKKNVQEIINIKVYSDFQLGEEKNQKFKENACQTKR